jgi:ubiquinone/menaquinone biosynthesis C-methylase UbiE
VRFYEDRVLPRVINVVMNTGGLRKLRARTAEGLHGTVVELGFGSGLNLPHLPTAVERLYAIDPATLGRDLARARIRTSPVPIEFPSLHGESIDLPGDTADCALITWSMCTIPDLAAALAEVRRVLKPGGALHFVEHGLAPDPGTERWQRRIEPWQNRFAGGCSLIRRVDVEVEQAGFELDQIDRFYSKWTPHWIGFTYRGVARNP